MDYIEFSTEKKLKYAIIHRDCNRPWIYCNQPKLWEFATIQYLSKDQYCMSCHQYVRMVDKMKPIARARGVKEESKS